MPKYPAIKVRLTGKDGNAFAILGNVKQALKKGKVPQSEISAFFAEAMSGDYNHLLATCSEYVTIS